MEEITSINKIYGPSWSGYLSLIMFPLLFSIYLLRNLKQSLEEMQKFSILSDKTQQEEQLINYRLEEIVKIVQSNLIHC